MLMLLSLCMALVGAESGAEGGGGGLEGRVRQDSLSQLASKVKGQEEAAAICRTGGWRGEGPLESLSQVPLRRDGERC